MSEIPESTMREARELREIVDRLRGLTAGACLACQREQHPREVSELCVSADAVDRIADDLEHASRSVAAALAERDRTITELCAERDRSDGVTGCGGGCMEGDIPESTEREARELMCDSTWGCCHGEHYGLCVLRGSGGEDAVIRVAAALAERDRRDRNPKDCDACTGTGKPVSGGQCMCGGTGNARDAVNHLRERLLERDRTITRLRAEWEHLACDVVRADAEIADLRARCAELETDRERLDYLVHVGSDGVRQGENANWSVGREDLTWVESDNLRAAIDAARRQETDDAKE